MDNFRFGYDGSVGWHHKKNVLLVGLYPELLHSLMLKYILN